MSEELKTLIIRQDRAMMSAFGQTICFLIFGLSALLGTRGDGFEMSKFLDVGLIVVVLGYAAETVFVSDWEAFFQSTGKKIIAIFVRLMALSIAILCGLLVKSVAEQGGMLTTALSVYALVALGAICAGLIYFNVFTVFWYIGLLVPPFKRRVLEMQAHLRQMKEISEKDVTTSDATET